MGSFKGHVLPGTLFLLVGLWRVWSSTSRHAASPSTFRVRAWNPINGAVGSSLRLLELYVVAGGAFADMCVEVLYSTHLRIFVDGGEVNPAHLNDLEHGGMLLMFFLFGVLALASQIWPRYFPLTDGALCLIAATAFTAEFVLFYFHSTTHMGLEGYYHYLLVILVAVTGELPGGPGVRRARRAAGPLVLPDGVHAVRAVAPGRLRPRRRRTRRVSRARRAGESRADRELPVVWACVRCVLFCGCVLCCCCGEVWESGAGGDA